MLKTKIEHNHDDALNNINLINNKSIKSSEYYKGYNTWFNEKFIPSYINKESSIVTIHCKTYNTMLGFALLKHDLSECKISNLSPLVDGVGITQALLDSCEFILDKDYDIYIPDQAIDLISKVKNLGFHHINMNISNDNTKQHKFSKPKNISWI